MTPFERGFMLFQEYDSRRVIDEPKQDKRSKAIPATKPASRHQITSALVIDKDMLDRNALPELLAQTEGVVERVADKPQITTQR